MADKMILGENCVFPYDSRKTGINNNVLVVGGSGAGKTVSILEPHLLETYTHSLIVPVSKRRIVDKYTPMFEKRGFQVFDLDFVHPEQSTVGYNMLMNIRTHQDITHLAKSILLANPKKEKSNADPYWDSAGITLLSALIAVTMMVDESPTFLDVLDLYDHLEIREGSATIRTNLDGLFERVQNRHPNCFALRCWKSFSNLPIRTAGCVYGTVSTELDNIFTPEVRKCLGKSDKLDITQIAETKTVLFITTSPVNTALHSLVNIFYGDVIKQLFEFAENQPNGRLPIPVQMLCDDFAVGGRILNFPEYISIFREKDLAVTLLVQSESQLHTMYSNADATTVINNCDSYVFLGGMDLDTAKNVSLRLNKPLEDVLYMPVGQEILFRRGMRPVITQRYNVFADTRYQIVTRNYEKRLAQRVYKKGGDICESIL